MSYKISVIIPVYNIQDYIKECVESVLHQTEDNIQIILVDDGSTDDSGKICDTFVHNENVSVIHKMNGGLSSARNVGLKVATGDYIFFLDGDDWIEADAIERLYDLAVQYDVDFVRFRLKDEKGNTVSLGKDDLLHEGLYTNEVIVRELYPYLICTQDLDLGVVIGVWRSLYKRSFLLENNFWFEDKVKYSEDILFSPILMTKVNRFYYTEEGIFYHYRVNQSSISKSFRKDRWKSYKVLYEQMECYFQGFGEMFTNQLKYLSAYLVLRLFREYHKNDRLYLKKLMADPVFKEMVRKIDVPLNVSMKNKMCLSVLKLCTLK